MCSQTNHFSRLKQEHNASLTCKVILDAMVSPDVQSKQFSWSGRKAKNDTAQIKTSFKLQASHIVEFIYSICVELHPSYTRSAMTRNMGSYLKSAWTRTADGKEKVKKNRRKTKRSPGESNDTVVTSISCEPDISTGNGRQTVYAFSEDVDHMDGSTSGEQYETEIGFNSF